MFDLIRSKTKLLMFLLVLLIIPSFVFFGIQGYSKFNESSGEAVAVVDGHKITRAEWDFAHQRQAERVRQQMPGVDAKLLDTPEFRRETLDSLVRERVLLLAVDRMHLSTSDDRLQRSFRADPQLAFLRNPDGTVNKDALAAQGMTSEQFAARLRQDLTLRQVLDGVTATVLESREPRRLALDAFLERREVQVQDFMASDFAAKIDPTDDELAAYYNDTSNQAQFQSPEQASIEYVVLDLEALKRGVNPTAEDLRKYYDENIARYTVAEERRASHILVKADKDAPAADRAKAKAKAEGLLAELRKNPAGFGDIARKQSDDPGSAARGGDLDFFGRGAMVKPFEDAVFAMKPGEISNLVETDFGYHIIRLDAVRGGEKKGFDAVRAQIEDEVRRQLAQAKYAEAAEQFTNTVYEQSDSLQPVIDKLQLTKQTATVARTPAPGATGALASAKLLESIFGNEALRNKRNTDAVEVGPNQMAAARVVQHLPQRLLPLAEVKDRVRDLVVRRQAALQARQAGEARLARIKADGDAAGLSAAKTVSRAQTEGLPGPLVDAVLRADASKLPVAIGVDLGDVGYAVARITKVQAPDAAAPEVTALQQRYAQAWAAAESRSYYEALKVRFKAKTEAAAAQPASAAAR